MELRVSLLVQYIHCSIARKKSYRYQEKSEVLEIYWYCPEKVFQPQGFNIGGGSNVIFRRVFEKSLRKRAFFVADDLIYQLSVDR